MTDVIRAPSSFPSVLSVDLGSDRVVSPDAEFHLVFGVDDVLVALPVQECIGVAAEHGQHFGVHL